MNKINRIIAAAVVAGALSFVGQGLAQSQMTGPDGLTTSPRLRQQLNERPVVLAYQPATCPACSRPGVTTVSPGTAQTGQAVIVSGPAPWSEAAANSPTRQQPGVVASPRLQEQLNQ